MAKTKTKAASKKDGKNGFDRTLFRQICGQQQEAFAQERAGGGDGPKPPEGVYTCELTKVECGVFPKRKVGFIKPYFTIRGGRQDGFSFTEIATTDENRLWILKKMMIALYGDTDMPEGLAASMETAIKLGGCGRFYEVAAKVNDRGYTNIWVNEHLEADDDDDDVDEDVEDDDDDYDDDE